jgi:hypothetical protein
MRFSLFTDAASTQLRFIKSSRWIKAPTLMRE